MDILSKITIGTDPELFLYDHKEGRLKSAVGLIGGTKEQPRKLGTEYFVQEDNVAVEFNIPPCSTADEFDLHIEMAMDAIRMELPDHLELIVQPSGMFDPEELNTRAARHFGCDPDYNAWSGLKNHFTISSEFSNLRVCGGHLHTGFPFQAPVQDLMTFIKAQDLHQSVPAVLMDNDTLRRQLYGKAGAYRIKPYGVEYRTLSNFWIQNSALRQWAFHTTKDALQFVMEGKAIDHDLGQTIQDTINNNDKTAAEALVAKFNLKVA